jgi:hypothetical protein
MSLINFYNPFIPVNNFKFRPETYVDRDHAHFKGWVNLIRPKAERGGSFLAIFLLIPGVMSLNYR